MGILGFLSKITGIEDKVKWSRAKKIEVIGPSFFGHYYIYVDPYFKVAIFLPKADKTLHIFIGNIVEGHLWQKYDSNGIKVHDDKPPKGAFEWKINPRNVLFRGTGFPPEQLIYEGKVISFESFSEVINDEWITKKKDEYMKMIKQDNLSEVEGKKYNTLEDFESAIKKYENQLFGIRLFAEGIKLLYSHDKKTLDTNHHHFKNIMQRGENTISQAKELLEKAKNRTENVKVLKDFQFPPVHGPGLDEMTQRATLLVQAYEKLFPDRPRDMPLTAEEHEKLMQETLNNF